MFAWAVPISIGAMTAFDWLVRLYRQYDIDQEEGDWAPPRWIAWGTIRSSSRNSNHDFRYFLVRLPSYDWTHNWYNDRDQWVQRALMWFELSGWRMTYLDPLHDC